VLIPKEHGAYGQLACPALTALAAGRVTTGALAVAIAAFLTFLAHEALLVLLGQRGRRAAREQRRPAWRALIVFGGSAALIGIGAVAWMTPGSQPALLVPLALAGVLAALVAARAERTTAGECLAALTLSSVSIPIGMAAGLTADAAWAIALVFAAAFTSATISVRAIISPIARAGGPSRRAAALVIAGSIALLIALGARGLIAPGAAPALVPVSAVAGALILRPPPVARLRTVGWTLVAASALTAVMLIVQLKQAG
jgi:YwiC-like protein